MSSLKYKHFTNKYSILLVILVLSFIIRCIAGHVQSFSNDELSALYRLQYSNFYDLMYWGVQVDNHPALTQLFLYYYEPLVPKGEIFLRLPFIIATTISLGYIFFSFKKLSGEFTAYMVTTILAFAGFSVQLGYFARPYAFGILFTSAATYYWVRIFFEKEKSKKSNRRLLFLFTLFSIMAAYTHYLALLQIVILGTATFVFAPIRLWWKIIVSGLITILAFLPHYTITLYHLSVGGIGAWLGKPKDYFIVDLLFEYFNRSALVVGFFILLAMVVIIVKPTNPKIRNFLLLGFLSVVPYLILYFYSVKINPLLQYSACFFLMPYLLGTFFSLFETELSQSKYIKWLYIAGIAMFLTSSLFFYKIFAPIHFAEFKKIARYIEEHESDSVTTVVAVNNPFYINYYLKDKKPDLYITDMGDNLSFLKRYIDTCKTPEFIYAFANKRSNGEIPFIIREEFHNMNKVHQFVNSELYSFKKGDNGKLKDEEYLYKYIYNDSKNIFETYDENIRLFFKGAFFMKDLEYSPTYEVDLSVLKLKPYNEVVASITVFGELNFCDMELVLSIENNNKVVFWRSRKLSQQYHKNHENKIIISEHLNHDGLGIKHGKLKAYLWNPNKCGAIAGPFTIEVRKGNPYTTGYSK